MNHITVCKIHLQNIIELTSPKKQRCPQLVALYMDKSLVRYLPYTAPISLKLNFFDFKLNSTRYLFDSLSKRAFDSKLLSTFEILKADEH